MNATIQKTEPVVQYSMTFRNHPEKQMVFVKSSNGQGQYTVCLYRGHVSSCDCQAFYFKHTCKHGALAEDYVKETKRVHCQQEVLDEQEYSAYQVEMGRMSRADYVAAFNPCGTC